MLNDQNEWCPLTVEVPIPTPLWMLVVTWAKANDQTPLQAIESLIRKLVVASPSPSGMQHASANDKTTIQELATYSTELEDHLSYKAYQAACSNLARLGGRLRGQVDVENIAQAKAIDELMIASIKFATLANQAKPRHAS